MPTSFYRPCPKPYAELHMTLIVIMHGLSMMSTVSPFLVAGLGNRLLLPSLLSSYGSSMTAVRQVLMTMFTAADDKQTAEPEQAESESKAEAKSEAQQPNSKDSKQEGQKGSSKKQDKGKTGKPDSKAKAKANAKTSDKSKKPGRGKGKDKNRDIEDLKSKLPPGIKTFDFNDFKDLDMESLKTKLEGMNGDKQGEQPDDAFYPFH